ncbi:MAG: hydroxyethylthiazole kinase [Syntrophobacteraceae bacterium]
MKIVEDICINLEKIRRTHPLIHNITNYVVMNFTANVLLALGASPVMAHAREEVEEMVGLAKALVVNIGTLSSTWIESMSAAVRAARRCSIPIVLDPVGAGATRFRTQTALRLLEEARPTVLRANGSEILALAGGKGDTKGVDSAAGPEEARQAAIDLAKSYGIVVAVTGARDFVTDGSKTALISNGHELMSRVTGTGCAASAVTGAFCAVEEDAFAAATGALATFGIAGEIAARGGPGPGSFQINLLDGLNALESQNIRELIHLVLL